MSTKQNLRWHAKTRQRSLIVAVNAVWQSLVTFYSDLRRKKNVDRRVLSPDGYILAPLLLYATEGSSLSNRLLTHLNHIRLSEPQTLRKAVRA